MNFLQYMAWLASGNSIKLGPSVNAGAYSKPTPSVNAIFDDFDGDAGSAPNPTLWNPLAGVARATSITAAENVTIDGNSNLSLAIVKQVDGSWHSSIVEAVPLTGNGYYAASIKVTGGHGFHQSFWSMGTGHTWFPEGGWPTCGETDIFECIGDGIYYSTVHGPMYQPNGQGPYNQSRVQGMMNFMPSQGYHLFWAQKTSQRVTFGIDSTTVGAIGTLSIPGGAPWELTKQQKVLFSLTMNEAGWGAQPDGTTPDSAAMLVDWYYYEPSA